MNRKSGNPARATERLSLVPEESQKHRLAFSQKPNHHHHHQRQNPRAWVQTNITNFRSFDDGDDEKLSEKRQ